MKNIVVKRIIFYFFNVFICFLLLINYMSKVLNSSFVDYGRYQCNNIMHNVINIAVGEQVKNVVDKDVFINQTSDFSIIDFNVEALNSVLCNVINRSYQIFGDLENGILDDSLVMKINNGVDGIFLKNGISYKLPVSQITNNFLLGNLGFEIPIRYKIIGEIGGKIISDIREYGINNALLEIKIEVIAKTKIIVPLSSDEKEVSSTVPLLLKVIQGKIPNYFFGSHLIGGTE